MDFPFTGVIPIDKPPGATSRQVVNGVARALGMKTVGHAGTLDPLAAGVVVVCVGHATKLVDYVHQLPKRYEAVFLLGRSSPSDDLETQVEEEVDPRRPTRDDVEAALPAFRGDILQRPCDYSAVHVNGQRAYHLARKGRSIELPAKSIRIDRFEITSYDWPRLAARVTCSTGTFIRALGRDLAIALGTQAVMESLVRTSVGPFVRASSMPLGELRPETVPAALLAPLAAVPHLERVVLADGELDSAVRGGLVAGALNDREPPPEHLAAVDPAGDMIGILKRHSSGAYRLRPNFRGVG
jgi:tRNA pseudouridine55 synthase